MEIQILDQQDEIKIDLEVHKTRVQKILESLNREKAELSLLFVDNNEMRKLNRQYRGKDRPTDVLSFPQGEGEFAHLQPDLLGDIVISLPKAKTQAEERGQSLEEEVDFLLIHGILHLLGYDHERSEEEEALMRKKEQELLKIIR